MSPEREPAAGDAGRAESATSGQDRHTGRQIAFLEWIAGGIGALLVLGSIGYLVHNAVLRDQGPPDIRLAAAGMLELKNGYLVQFRAFNEGRSAAAEVTVEGELVGRDGTVETSEAVLDYLPARSDREGGLLFEGDPRTGALSLRATGYAKP